MSFSERYGYKPIKESIQIESMDEPLRNGLWSILKVHCWDNVKECSGDISGQYYLCDSNNLEIYLFCKSLWLNYFKKPLDQLKNDWSQVLSELRRYFFDCKWNEVYDFIEFICNNYERNQFKERFIQSCNLLLKKEMSAYRFVNGVVTRITEIQEISEIEQALKTNMSPVNTHLQCSLENLSDRKAPNYRNSVKESISAVESLVKITLKTDKGTLAQLIKNLEDKIGLHPALGKAFSNLYGYTSDEKGIRHALIKEENVDFNDAKFMLVVCSAFINFVKGKIQK